MTLSTTSLLTLKNTVIYNQISNFCEDYVICDWKVSDFTSM